MGRSRTINLTRADTRETEDKYIKKVLTRPFVYDDNIAERCLIKSHYFEQSRLAHRKYADRFKKLNKTLLEDVDSFVDTCLNTRGQQLFAGNEAESIFGTMLNLEMQISDHEPTFNLIERLLKKHKNLTVTRIKVASMRKRNILDELELYKQSKRVLILIEQAETMSRSVTDMLVGHLKSRIDDPLSPTSVVMVLFCICTHIQELPFDHVNCFGRMNTIKRESQNAKVLEDLVRSRGLRMKLGSRPLGYIYDYYLTTDPSMASLVYMYDQALFQHYYELENAYATMDEATRSSCFSTTLVDDRHQYLCDQLYSLTELIGERGLYAECVSDLYRDLSEHHKLTESVEFIDAVKNLSKFSQEALLRRIGRVVELSQQNQRAKNGKVDMISILSKYKDKILNNPECDEVVTRLMDELLAYAESLPNPLEDKKSYAYFNDDQGLIDSTLTSLRLERELKRYFCADESYFQILLDQHILKSPGLVGVYDLSVDVAEAYKNLIRRERSCANKKGPRIKFTPKKRGDRSARAPKHDLETRHKDLSPEEEDGLAKALFVDVIDCMAVQQLVKLDLKIQGKHMKRLIWPA